MSGSFRTTRWSVVAAASGPSGDAASRRALSELCEAYWLPIYAFARTSGDDAEAARDLTQGFFTALLEKNYVAAADADRGRFRTFLITSFRHFRSKERDKAHAEKRGGHRPPLPLEFEDGEARLAVELSSGERGSPERAYERRWALTLLARVLDRLSASYEERGKSDLFEALRPSLEDPSRAGGYGEIGDRLGMSVSAVKVAMHRLRTRYRDMLRREVADTVVTEHGVARLLGKSVRQRAEELISVAHPDHRGELRKAAQRQFYP